KIEMMRIITCLSAFLIAFVPTTRAQWHSLGNVTGVQTLANGLELNLESGRVWVVALSPNIVRFRYSAQASFPADDSFAVLPSAFSQATNVQTNESADSVTLDTGELRVQIFKSPLRIVFFKPDGTTISEDHPNHPTAFNGSEFRVWKSMPMDEHYFGLGD